MKRRLTALSAVPLLLVLAGCGSVQEAAESAASDAASKVATAAADEVTKQVCAVIQDGLVSAEDKAVLGGLVAAAETSGVPSDITTPLGRIAEAGDQVPAESVTALKDACPA
jgi:outer membrane lipoprotein SlyB